MFAGPSLPPGFDLGGGAGGADNDDDEDPEDPGASPGELQPAVDEAEVWASGHQHTRERITRKTSKIFTIIDCIQSDCNCSNIIIILCSWRPRCPRWAVPRGRSTIRRRLVEAARPRPPRRPCATRSRPRLRPSPCLCPGSVFDARISPDVLEAEVSIWSFIHFRYFFLSRTETK